MTPKQSKEFVLNELADRHPVFFSDEAVEFIFHAGGLRGKCIHWQGRKYDIIKRHETTRILETRLRRKSLRGPIPEAVNRALVVIRADPTNPAWVGLPSRAGHEEASSSLHHYHRYRQAIPPLP